MRQFQSLHYDTLLQYKPLEFSFKLSLSEAKCASERQIAFFINPHIKRSALYLLNLSRRLDFAPKFKLCLRGYVTLWAWGAFADPGLKIDTKHHKIPPSQSLLLLRHHHFLWPILCGIPRGGWVKFCKYRTVEAGYEEQILSCNSLYIGPKWSFAFMLNWLKHLLGNWLQGSWFCPK